MNCFIPKNIFILSLIFLSGCQQIATQSESQIESVTSSTSEVASGECPEQPNVVLDPQTVEPILFENKRVILSGIAKKNQTLGYTFEARSDQKLNYQTEEDICIWIYTPDNQLLDSKNLPVDGKYTIQVSAPKGSATFELEIGFDLPQNSSFLTQNTSIDNSSQFKPLEERPPADEFVRNHYININNRNYELTWNKLSPRFQKIAISYSAYQEWWDSVSEVRIENIYLINQTQNNAVVNAELVYVMNTGKYFKDPKQRIYLIWDEFSNSWLFENKV